MTRLPGQLLIRLVIGLRRFWRALSGRLTRWGLPPLQAYLSLTLGVFCIAFVRYGLLLGQRLQTRWIGDEAFHEAVVKHGQLGLANTLLVIAAIAVPVLLAGMAIGRAPRPLVLSFVRKCYILGYALLFAVWWGIRHFTDAVAGDLLPQKDVSVSLFYWRWDLTWPLGLLFLLLAVAHLVSWRRIAILAYGMPAPERATLGDRIVEDVRSHGSDPRYRKSLLTAISVHVAVIIGPLLLMRFGCVEPYRIPKGSGNPVVTLVKMVKPPKKKKKKYLLRPDSAIFFSIPDFEDSDIEKQVDDETQVRYTTDPNQVHGQPGQGKGQGGWPDGMDNAVVRFIRLEYRGPDWDDGMDARARADLNFLDAFHERTGFKVSDHAESNPILRLAQYPKGMAPPFVYMTGSGSINLSPREMTVLREYLLEGGMLFADAGSAQWDRSFRGLMQAMFPDKPLLNISDDDPIYTYPYVFPNGPPPLWHHGGFRSMGVKHRDRWIVFYFPGDMNDAWKTGNSGVSKDLAEASFDIGVNIVYYAFTHYLEETRKYRK